MTTESRWTPIATFPLDGGNGTVELRYETPDWQAVYEIRAVGGRPAIASVRLEPRADTPIPPPLPAILAREMIRTGEALEQSRKYLSDDLVATLLRGMPPLASYLDLDHGRGKRQPDYFYAAIAAPYVQAVEAGSRSPVADAAEALGDDYQPPFVRDALDRARKRKLLTRPESRGAGGELTPLGHEVLDAGAPDGYAGPSA